MDLRDRRDARGNTVEQQPRLRRRVGLLGLADGRCLKTNETPQKGKIIPDPVIGFGNCSFVSRKSAVVHGRSPHAPQDSTSAFLKSTNNSMKSMF
ncbi:MAG: hypothetical protein WDM89_12240 [Rhizomicrobium sp.]